VHWESDAARGGSAREPKFTTYLLRLIEKYIRLLRRTLLS
jgi:hypothetical protein